ncbi:MAG: hypothetical protein K0V04_35385 [Deltaproteobacteria bacterium]|nr:hypothetical protein [Deltaproteobacteria bacterium]
MYDRERLQRTPPRLFGMPSPKRARMRAPAAVLGTATAVPERWFSQAEILEQFGYRDDPVARKMFLRNGMEGRYLSLEPKSFFQTKAPGFQQGLFQRAAVDLAEQSVRRLLDEQGVDPSRIEGLVTITSYGFVVPSISAYLVDRLGLRRDLARLDLTGAGCLGSISLLEAADGMIAKGRSGLVVAVSSEVGSIFMRDWPGDDKGAMVINALMGDASVATLLGAGSHAEGPPRPRLLDTQYATAADTLWAVDIRTGQDGTMSGHIDRKVPSIARGLYQEAFGALLDRHGLTRDDIRHWPIHPGSRVVIEAVADALDLSESDIETSREVLRKYGNVCSATALMCLHEQLERGGARSGDYGILGGVGPGMTVGMTLFQYV